MVAAKVTAPTPPPRQTRTLRRHPAAAYDALFFSGTGVSGPTRPMPSRLDALSTAAHAVARHCRRLLDSSASQARADRRAATEVIRWLELLDLL